MRNFGAPLPATDGGTGVGTAAAELIRLGLMTAVAPQGRLTLSASTPVLLTAVSAATAVLYTPYVGSLLPLWNGTSFVPTNFSETSQSLSDTTKSPAAAKASMGYDLFGWSDGGTVRVTRGPAWTAGATAGAWAAGGGTCARGSGAGSTALTRVNGILVNAVAVANGPAPGYGTYLGTIATDSSGATVSFNPGGAGPGGVAAVVGLWNAYNRVPAQGYVQDTTSSWSYAGQAWRAANSSSTIRVTFVCGLSEDAWSATYAGQVAAGMACNAVAGVGFDSTTGYTGSTQFVATGGSGISGTAIVKPLGQHFLTAIEYNAGTTAAATWYGAIGGYGQSGLNWSGRY